MAIVRSGRLVKLRRTQRPTSTKNEKVRPRGRVLQCSRSARESALAKDGQSSTSFTRVLTLLWKRFTKPFLPRRSLRFSFIPPGFVGFDPEAEQKKTRALRRQGRIWELPPTIEP
ncbi:unnamed protein product [Cyclocybe aegerita]|uniref:Uncharacterized protein n=1 Tax=Cyclocybe aegerita TaxID=1973307 RepID=A0A8S0WL65_CYCAE|nr:unnamed protein product [Cyclocybe aegerita]